MVQNALCLAEDAVMFLPETQIGCHAVMLHEPDGNGKFSHGVEQMVSTAQQLFGERVKQVNMCGMPYVNKDIHSVCLKRMP